MEPTKLQRIIIWSSIAALLAGVGFVAWLAWGLMEVVGVR